MATEHPDFVSLEAFRDTSRYYRSGMMLVDEPAGTSVEDLAMSLPGDIVSWPAELVAELRPDQQYVECTAQSVLNKLKALARGPAKYPGRIVVGVDFALAKWSRDEIISFWDEFIQLERNAPHALIVVLPASASELLPHFHDMKTLEESGRLVRIT